MGAVFAPTRFSLVRISVRDRLAGRKSSVREFWGWGWGSKSDPQRKAEYQEMAGVGIPWTWKRSISGLRPEMGMKMAKKWTLASPEKWGKNGLENEKNGPDNGKNGPKMEFQAILPASPIFRVRPKSIFRPHFGPEARNGSIPGPRDFQGWGEWWEEC